MNNQQEMNIGHMLKLLRTAANIKQRDLAHKVGMKGNYLSLVESGKRTPSISLLQRLAKALDVPLSLLFLEIEADHNKSSLKDRAPLLKIRRLLLEMERLRIEDQAHSDQQSPEHAAR
jgi:transcriptional regulator with XRE-family HTH domain